MKIEQTDSSTIKELWSTLKPKVEKATCLEEAAQELATGLHTTFNESVVLTRVFLTIPFDSLPASNKEFVKNLAESAGADTGLNAVTPVLSLIGTHGQESDWNDRRNSKGHVGIPLISSEFVGAIPMISRLLKDFGVPMDWIDNQDSEIIKKTMSGSSGLFFVDNAAESVDNQGRKIIAAQDFVSSYGVKCVFGIGEVYTGGQILVVVVFCRDSFSQAVAKQVLPLVNSWKDKTSSLVGTMTIFAG